MRTIQMTLDDDLVTAVDRFSKELRTNSSVFARKALRMVEVGRAISFVLDI